MSKWLILIGLPLITSFITSALIIRFLGQHLLDTPNNRSSHTIPTPRGGGIAIAISFIATLFVSSQMGYISPDLCWKLVIPCSLICMLGMIDDAMNLSVKVRLFIQFLVAGLGLYLLDFENHLSPIPTIATSIIMLFSIVWMTNLYNFMDGINGLAALEGVCVCIGMLVIFSIAGSATELSYALFILAAGICGFLYWNFPTAKLFMGDSGSLFLGLFFGLLTVEQLGEKNELVAAWVIMLGVFIVDASYTLTYRYLLRQSISQAHRSHTYQKVAAKYQSHALTSLSITAINLLWLLPIASLTACSQLHYFYAIPLAFAPLILIAKKYNAGKAN